MLTLNKEVAKGEEDFVTDLYQCPFKDDRHGGVRPSGTQQFASQSALFTGMSGNVRSFHEAVYLHFRSSFALMRSVQRE